MNNLFLKDFEETTNHLVEINRNFTFEEVQHLMNELITLTKNIQYIDFIKLKLYNLNILSDYELLKIKDYYSTLLSKIENYEDLLNIFIFNLNEYNNELKAIKKRLSLFVTRVENEEDLIYLYSYVKTIQITSMELLINNNNIVLEKITSINNNKVSLLKTQIAFFVSLINSQNTNKQLTNELKNFMNTSNEIRREINEIIQR